jgi:hypothetical protein
LDSLPGSQWKFGQLVWQKFPDYRMDIFDQAEKDV